MSKSSTILAKTERNENIAKKYLQISKYKQIASTIVISCNNYEIETLQTLYNLALVYCKDLICKVTNDRPVIVT